MALYIATTQIQPSAGNSYRRFDYQNKLLYTNSRTAGAARTGFRRLKWFIMTVTPPAVTLKLKMRLRDTSKYSTIGKDDIRALATNQTRDLRNTLANIG